MAPRSPVHMARSLIADGSAPDPTASGHDVLLPPALPAGGLAGRLRGPGGLYNIGNAIALAVGLGVQVASATGEATLLASARGYFVGSPGAIALTIATLVFFASGEMYHRAWAAGAPPDRHLNRHGDLLSAAGALALTVALAFYGQLLLALASGLLLAGAKAGNALVPETDPSGNPAASPWPRRFRRAAMASRLPALAALAAEMANLAGLSAPAAAFVMPATMALCHLLWLRADILLARPAAA